MNTKYNNNTLILKISLIILSLFNFNILLSQCGTNMNLTTWTPINATNAGSPANWTTIGTNAVRQTVNCSPASFFISPFDLINVRFSGQFMVGNTADDDFVGFVFGYQNPLSGNYAVKNFYRYQMTRFNAPTHTFRQEFDHIVLPGTSTQYLSNSNFAGWRINQTYNFTCFFTSTSIKILIDGVEVVDTTGCFHPGKFGFYNFSQNNVTYSNFKYNVIADFNIAKDSICLGDAIDLSIFCDPSFINPYVTTTWDLGDGTIQSNTDQINHIYQNPGTYNVKLTITDVNGCSDNITKTITVLDPAFDLGIDKIFCENIQSSETLTVFQNNPNQYIWNTGAVASSIVVNQTGTYTVKATNVIGCVANDTIQITFNSPPLVNFTFSNVCDNEKVQINDNSTVNASGATNYYWDINEDGVTDYNTQNIQHLFNNQGQYSVRHIVENSNGCSDTISKQVTVYALPQANFTVDAVCEDTVNTFTNTSSFSPVDGGTIASYDWDFGNGNTSTQENPTQAYGTENIYTTQFIIKTSFGCKDTIQKSVTVYPLPNINFYPTDVCLNNQTIFTDNSSVSNTHTTNNLVNWSWDFDDGIISSQQNPSHTYITDGIYHVNLEVSSNNDCNNDTTITVTVYPLAVVDFTFSNVCDNEMVQINDNSTVNASGTTNYYWDINEDGVTDYNTQNIQHLFNNQGQYNVRHIVKNSNGCSDTISKQITVYALPQSNFTVDAVCEDTVNTFTNTSSFSPVDGGTIASYDWDFGNGNTSTQENPTQAYGTENIYTTQLIVTSSFNCKDTIQKSVTVYPLPNVNFSPTDVCLNFKTKFSDLSTVNNQHTTNNLVNWNWDFGDGGSSTTQNPIHQYNTDGTFNAILSVMTNNGCINDTTLVVTVHPLPVVSFTGQNLAGCAPICPNIVSTSTINTPSTLSNFEWTLSGGQTYSGSSFSDCYENLSGQGNYYDVTLKITSNEGCVNSKKIDNYISVYHNPIANFYITPKSPYVDEIDIIHTKVSFHNTSSYADSYQWDISDNPSIHSTQINPTIDFPAEPATYQPMLIAITDKNCRDTIYGSFRIKDRVLVYVPNTFTPDKNYFNETFKPIFGSGYDPYSYTLYIFNRFGELIFESHDTNKGWDGSYGNKIVQDGTYIWKIEFKESETDKRHTMTGNLNLLR